MVEALVLCFGLLFCGAFFLFVFETVRRGIKSAKKPQKTNGTQPLKPAVRPPVVRPAKVQSEGQGGSGSLVYASTEGEELHEAGFHGNRVEEKNNEDYLVRSRLVKKTLTPEQLREAFVLSEILSPPLSRRGQKRKTW